MLEYSRPTTNEFTTKWLLERCIALYTIECTIRANSE